LDLGPSNATTIEVVVIMWSVRWSDGMLALDLSREGGGYVPSKTPMHLAAAPNHVAAACHLPTQRADTSQAKSEGYKRSRNTRVFAVAVSNDESGDNALEWLMSELVEDGDEVVAIRVIELDEGGEWDSMWLVQVGLLGTGRAAHTPRREDRPASTRGVQGGGAPPARVYP
jgi:hypothetical protein